MDVDNIKCVLKVAECLSINRASFFLYKTQSQVSRIIRNFEELVNVTLFERSPKGLKITPEGDKILQYCQQIVALYDEMIIQGLERPNQPPYTGKIHFYNSVNIYSTIGKILSAFTSHYPQIALSYTTCHPHDIINGLLSFDNAIGLLAQIYLPDSSPYYPIDDELEFTELLTLPIIGLCAANSSYAAKYKTLSAKTLSLLPLIDFNPYNHKQSFTSTVVEIMNAAIKEFQYATDDLRILQNLLENGSGIYVGIYPSASLVNDNIIGLPIRERISIGFGVLKRRESKNTLVNLLSSFLIDWYKKLY